MIFFFFFFISQFASAAKNVKNKPHVNEVLDDEALLKRYRKEITDLKKQLDTLEVSKSIVFCFFLFFMPRVVSPRKTRFVFGLKVHEMHLIFLMTKNVHFCRHLLCQKHMRWPTKNMPNYWQ